jgi:hypothetical protein
MEMAAARHVQVVLQVETFRTFLVELVSHKIAFKKIRSTPA